MVRVVLSVVPVGIVVLVCLAGCGRTGLFGVPVALEEEGPVERCAGRAWAGNVDGELVLVDVEARRAEVYATMPHGTWAFGTMPTGALLLGEAIRDNPTIWGFGPFSGEFRAIDGWSTPDNLDRGATDERGRLWAMAVPSQEIRIYDVDDGFVGTVRHDFDDWGAGGDLVIESELVYAAWWPGELARFERDADALRFLDRHDLPARADELVSGLARIDDDLWFSTMPGRLTRIAVGDTGASATEVIETGFTINDLAPVLAPVGQCPGLDDL